jgi:predicted component of type VI protein secretion system
MPLIITIRDLDSGASTRFESELSPVRIGRNALNELVLEAGFVSQFHGVMRFDDVGIHYKDLGSTNGSTLAGQRLARNTEVPLAPGSDLRIGPLRLEAEVRGPIGVGARTPPGKSGTRHVRTLYGLLRQPDAEPVGEPAHPTGPVPSASTSASASASAGRSADHARGPSETQRIARGLAGRLLPPGREPATEAEARRLIDAVAVILDAFAHSFVGLRRGVEQTGAELGIRTVPSRSPLYLAKDHLQVLAHLLDPAREPQQAAEELVGVFADFGIHQVALLNGITESVKALLSRIAGREPAPPTRGARGKRWRFGGDARKVEATIRELLEDDRHLHAAIFGEEFGLAYAAGTLGGHQKEKP